MKKTILTLAALLVAVAAVFTAPAHAGGKRLQFGHPLGSFVAKSHSGGSSYGHRRSRRTHRAYAAKKAAARRAAARRAAARRAAVRKAAARRLAAKKAAKARAVAARRRKSASVRRVAAVATQNDVIKLAPVKASAIAGTNTLEFEDESGEVAVLPAVTEVKAINGTTDSTEVATEEVENENDYDDTVELECKKFIPSAGLTITIPCGS
jgi:hypothetical protein